MKWVEFIVYTPHEAEEAVSNILNEQGSNGVIIEDIQTILKKKRTSLKEIFEVPMDDLPHRGIRIKAYFPKNQNWLLKKEVLQTKIKNLENYAINIDNLSFDESVVEETDWENEWKNYFDIQKITDHIVIVPSWLNYTPHANDKIIHIDPGMAFGTGTHPTTILSVLALEKFIKQKDIVIDVGVGSGILSIAAKLLGANHVYSYDMDPVAVKSAKMNIDLNNMSKYITVRESNLLNRNKHRANIIVANILAEVLIDLVNDAKYDLKDNGYFILSGIIEEKQQLVLDKLTANQFEIIETNQDDHWISIVAQKKGV